MAQTNKLKAELYDGDITITMYPDSHRYRKNDETTYLISVTAATGVIDKSRFLLPWAVGLAGSHLRQWCETAAGRPVTVEEILPIIDEAMQAHQKAKDAAAGIGDIVHTFAELFAAAKATGLGIPPEIPVDVDPLAIAGINGFLDFVNERDVEFLESERIVYSKLHDYVGLTDAIVTVDGGKKMLIDYKTSKAVYNEMYYQISAYRMAYEEETGESLDGAGILHFDKETGQYTFWVMSEEDYQKNKPVFLACLAIKRREKELYKWETANGR